MNPAIVAAIELRKEVEKAISGAVMAIEAQYDLKFDEVSMFKQEEGTFEVVAKLDQTGLAD